MAGATALGLPVETGLVESHAWIFSILLYQSLYKTCEGGRTDVIDSGEKLHDFLLAGLGMGLGAPQELMLWRNTARHLPVLQVF